MHRQLSVHRYETVSVDDAKPSTLSPSEMTRTKIKMTRTKIKTWCAGEGCVTVPVPVAFRNKCERVTGPQPERVRSIVAGVNATRTSGTGPERDRNANRNRCEHGLSAGVHNFDELIIAMHPHTLYYRYRNR